LLILEVGTIIEALRQHLGGTHDYALHCPRAVATKYAESHIDVQQAARDVQSQHDSCCMTHAA